MATHPLLLLWPRHLPLPQEDAKAAHAMGEHLGGMDRLVVEQAWQPVMAWVVDQAWPCTARVLLEWSQDEDPWLREDVRAALLTKAVGALAFVALTAGSRSSHTAMRLEVMDGWDARVKVVALLREHGACPWALAQDRSVSALQMLEMMLDDFRVQQMMQCPLPVLATRSWVDLGVQALDAVLGQHESGEEADRLGWAGDSGAKGQVWRAWERLCLRSSLDGVLGRHALVHERSKRL